MAPSNESATTARRSQSTGGQAASGTRRSTTGGQAARATEYGRLNLLILLYATAALLAGSNGNALAADAPSSRWAATSLADVDDDFAYQGEYYGPLKTGEFAPLQTMGLQVVARGGRNFIAVEYPGGLPGRGWYGGETLQLQGRRDGARLVLSGEGRRYAILDGSATLLDEFGNPHGSIVRVQRISRTLGQVPPPQAKILFGGSDTDRLLHADVTPDGLLKEGFLTKEAYGDYFLHLEFQLSYMPYARGQGRSNSGVYLQQRYEVQILDSFGLEGKDNECGGLYHSVRPALNMCLPPLAWQTYDIDFCSPRFDPKGNMIQHARLTVWQNGYPVHYMIDVPGKTGAGKAETPKFLPILFQHHDNPVRFQNIWIIERQWTPYVYRSIFPPGQSWDAVSALARQQAHHDYWNW
jgi:hypothetical protein